MPNKLTPFTIVRAKAQEEQLNKKLLLSKPNLNSKLENEIQTGREDKAKTCRKEDGKFENPRGGRDDVESGVN